jgi:hypothetical protein
MSVERNLEGILMYIYIFIMKLPLYIGGANRQGVGGASNYSY